MGRVHGTQVQPEPGLVGVRLWIRPADPIDVVKPSLKITSRNHGFGYELPSVPAWHTASHLDSYPPGSDLADWKIYLLLLLLTSLKV